jgi:hypothetical protein
MLNAQMHMRKCCTHKSECANVRVTVKCAYVGAQCFMRKCKWENVTNPWEICARSSANELVRDHLTCALLCRTVFGNCFERFPIVLYCT